jgi:hypothetical protein
MGPRNRLDDVGDGIRSHFGEKANALMNAGLSRVEARSIC